MTHEPSPQAPRASPHHATDLTSFLSCRHLTTLDRLAAAGLTRRPHFADPMLDLLRERGRVHERAYVDYLIFRGLRVHEIAPHSPAGLADTLAAMASGADAIVQARLEHGGWAGWADVLLRTPGTSRFGAYRYEPVETKLAKETRGTTVLQLCLYADLLAELQGAAPELLHVVVPGKDFAPETYRFDEFRDYFRRMQRNFEGSVALPLPASVDAVTTYPEPTSHCDVCNWYGECSKRRTVDDHLSLVAGIQKSQRKELGAWGVTTLAGLAQLPIPLSRRPSRGSTAALERVREQARLQLAARTTGTPTYELLAIEPDRGLAALPPPSRGDVFLDLEGDRHTEDGGFDYLFGYAVADPAGPPRYEAIWALSPEDEKKAFERVIDLVVARRAEDPSMHVFHYGAYEVTSMKRLACRYATRAGELDGFLREDVFVDLLSVVRQGLRAGIDSYSIKKLEPFYGLVREVDLQKVSRLLRAVEYAVARREAGTLDREVCAAVEGYNKDDCVSTLALRDWLEQLRLEAEKTLGAPVPRRSPPGSGDVEELDARLAETRALAAALTDPLPVERNATEQAQWILAQLLEWHRRENNVGSWEYHHLNDMAEEDLGRERDAIAELTFVSRIETRKRGAVVDRYSYPSQHTDVGEDDALYAPGSLGQRKSVAEVEAIDLPRCTIDLKKNKDHAARHPTSLFRHKHITNRDAEDALLRIGAFVRDQGIDAPGSYRAARDLLLHRNPRLGGGEPLRRAGESTLDSARRSAVALDRAVLAIQGPPGTGKTFTGARMIVDLVRAGKKVGVTANSHQVIRYLLDGVVTAAIAEGVPVRCLDKISTKADTPPAGIEEETDAKATVQKIQSRAYDVVGGTAWVWSKESLAEAIDVLVIDEAGQMSLANVLACSQAAKSLVLLGDPQQLEQPEKASHPEGSDLSALEYLLKGHETMPEARGLFLGETFRLHPAICSFTSDLFYEGKLHPHPDLSRQSLLGPTPYAGAGLHFVPVPHDGNQTSSPEEAERTREILESLTQHGVTFTDPQGHTKPLALADILVVAPYNAHVSEMASRVPGARVGTVDRFQGQEAPVVIYAMATSRPEEAPRGMGFLFNRNRLNVAISRARCVCILVGNPELFEPECRTPEEMRMANAFCAYLGRAGRG